MSQEDFPYWSVDLPGLDAPGARKLLDVADESLGIKGTAVDPRNWLTWHMDSATVEILRNALLDSGDEKCLSMIEELTDWLSSH